MDAIFSNTGTEWEQNTRLQGALMIRAVFGKVTNSILGTPENKLEAHIYPNPQMDSFTFLIPMTIIFYTTYRVK